MRPHPTKNLCHAKHGVVGGMKLFNSLLIPRLPHPTSKRKRAEMRKHAAHFNRRLRTLYYIHSKSSPNAFLVFMSKHQHEEIPSKSCDFKTYGSDVYSPNTTHCVVITLLPQN